MREISLDTSFGKVTGLRAGETAESKVLALHDWLDNAASFAPLQPYLDVIDLVAIDLPGHGACAHFPPDVQYTSYDILNAVLEAADALAWEHFALLGHGTGASTAYLFAATSPQRIRCLLLLDAIARRSERAMYRLRDALGGWRAWGKQTSQPFPNIDSAVHAWLQANVVGNDPISESTARLLVERGLMAVDDGYVWSSDPRLSVSSSQHLSEAQLQALIVGIECPVKIIRSELPPNDYYAPMPDMHVILPPRGELVILPGGHRLHMESPAEVATEIGEFLL